MIPPPPPPPPKKKKKKKIYIYRPAPVADTNKLKGRQIRFERRNSQTFPIAAVVFPAASRASVLSRILWLMPAISAMPPALSLMGP